MSIQIDASNQIILDDQATGLAVVQRRDGTVVYTPENRTTGLQYEQHWLPFERYSTTPAPLEGAAGVSQFEADIRQLLSDMHYQLSQPTNKELRAIAIEKRWFCRWENYAWVSCEARDGAQLDLNRAANFLASGV